MRECNQCGDVNTDDSQIECNGEYVDDTCVNVTEGSSYLGVPPNSSLKKLLKYLIARLKNVINYTGSLWTLPEYIDDTDAASGGLAIGKPYVTPTGEVRIRKV